MDKRYLLRTLRLAASRQGFTAPNPAVGAVIVKKEKVIGEGAHHEAGQPHAEIVALANCRVSPRDATLYVSLEPCCHYGRTPPCVKAIIDANIKKVFFCYQDPNPRVSGEGQKQLESAGIVCQHMPLPLANTFYRAYRHWTLTGKPWVTAKLALSQDGKIAGMNGKPVKITGPELHQFTHENRLKSDAILSTVKTVMRDNPAFNVRLGSAPVRKKIYLLDSKLRFPVDAQLYQTAESITLFHLAKYNKPFPSKIRLCPASAGLDLHEVIGIIGDQGIHSLWIETGARCFQSIIESQVANVLLLYIGNKTLGSDATDAHLNQESIDMNYALQSTQTFGDDVLLRYTLKGQLDSNSTYC